MFVLHCMYHNPHRSKISRASPVAQVMARPIFGIRFFLAVIKMKVLMGPTHLMWILSKLDFAY